MVILKGIPRLLSPQLLSVLARMGHGDEIGIYPHKTGVFSAYASRIRRRCFLLTCVVLADANFPSASIAKHGPELVRADGA